MGKNNKKTFEVNNNEMKALGISYREQVYALEAKYKDLEPAERNAKLKEEHAELYKKFKKEHPIVESLRVSINDNEKDYIICYNTKFYLD